MKRGTRAAPLPLGPFPAWHASSRPRIGRHMRRGGVRDGRSRSGKCFLSYRVAGLGSGSVQQESLTRSARRTRRDRPFSPRPPRRRVRLPFPERCSETAYHTGCEARFWIRRPWSYRGTGGTGELNRLLFPCSPCMRSRLVVPEVCSATRYQTCRRRPCQARARAAAGRGCSARRASSVSTTPVPATIHSAVAPKTGSAAWPVAERTRKAVYAR